MRPFRLILLLGVLFVLVVVKFFVLDTLHPPGHSRDQAGAGSAYAVPGVPTLVELGTDWCGPCRALKPTLLQLQKEYAGRAAIVLLNPEKDSAAQRVYAPQAYPTLVFHNADGSVHRRLEGSPGRDGILHIFKEMGIQ